MKHLRYIQAAGAVITGLALVQPAWAAGTLAGTLIQNTANATYSSGSGTTTIQSNTGNGNDSFDLTGAPNVSGNAFNATLQTVAIDTNGNGVYDPGVDTVITNGAASQTIAPDGSIKVFLIVAAPATAIDAQTSQVRLTGTSVTGSGTPGALFAGKGVGGVDAVVGASGGTANALAGLIASLATVTLTKSATIADPYGGTNPVPGATVTYSIVAHTTGSGTATGMAVNDAFPTGTTYQSGTMTLGGTVLTDAADGDAGTATSTGIAVQLGNVAGGTTDKTITFKVKIN